MTFVMGRGGWLGIGCLVFSAHLAAAELNFVALGDLPYGSDEVAGSNYRNLIDSINRTEPRFSIHVGDFKSGSTLCSDEEFQRQRRHFDRFSRPVVFTPGDNEWTDCHRKSNGSFDPLERLAKLRSLFFTPYQSLGATTMPVESQSVVHPKFPRYIENQRWVIDGVLFITVHIVGSNNNFETRDPKAVEEFFERDAANLAWINAGFDLASTRKIEAVIVAFQADVFESASHEATFPRHSGFLNVVGETLLPRAAQFGKPVLLINGDSHRFRFDRPFSLNRNRLANVYQLIVPGAQDVRAVRVSIDTNSKEPFKLSFIDP